MSLAGPYTCPHHDKDHQVVCASSAILKSCEHRGSRRGKAGVCGSGPHALENDPEVGVSRGRDAVGTVDEGVSCLCL